MKKNLNKKIIIPVLIIIVVFTFIFGIFFYSGKIEKSLEEFTETTLNEIAQQQQYTVNVKLQNEISSVKSVAKSIVMIEYDEEKVIEFISAVETFQDYQNVAIVGNDKIGVNSSGEIVNLADLEFLEEVLVDEKTLISETYESKKSGEKILYIATPIMEEEAIAGALVAEIPLENLNEAMLPSFEGREYSFIINTEGEIITSSGSEYTFESGNIFEVLDKAIIEEGYLLEKVKSDIIGRKEGHISYEVEGEGKRIAEYRPLDYNYWYLFNVIPEDVIAENANEINQYVNMYNIQTIIICVLIFLGIFAFRRNASKRIEKAAYYDELTNLPNLNKFKLDVGEILKKEKNKRFSVVKFDVINFKAINEIFDFESGNTVIKAIADVGKNSELKHFIQARIGTDEFLLFGPSNLFDNLEELRLKNEKSFKEKMEKINGHDVNFRYGRYSIPEGDVDINDVVNKVILAHTYAKKHNEIISDYDEDFKRELLKSGKLTGKMQDALDTGEFKVYVQPKYGAKTPDIVGGEALVRWQEKDGKFIFPDEFIPLFEENRFIIKLDMYMFESVCKTLRKRLKKGEKCVPISVNFSRLHISNKMFVEEIEKIANSYQIPRRLLEIELTESTIIEKEKELVELIEKLHASGFGLSMDDFGSGYSSLGMLRTINVDTIKLDRTFFDINKSEEKSKLIVYSILEMATKLGIKTVAEGVETKEQVDFLRETSCDIVQGYYYSKPVPIEEFEKLLIE